MYLSSTVNNGLIQELNRLCGTTNNTYPVKNKISDLNDALDWYLQLAFNADSQWNFDDLNETSPPIDTQNIVSGTNRYKVGSFTEKILNLLKLEILDSNSVGHTLWPEVLDDFGNVLGNQSGHFGRTVGGSFQELYIDAPSGLPTHYLKYGDFIYLRPKPNYSLSSALKAYFHRPLTKFQFVSCQPESDDDLITATGHGLSANDTVIFEVDSSGTMSGNLTADTQYYVISSGLTADVFKVSTTLGGSAVNISSDGSNVHFLKTNSEPGIPSIHHITLARKAASLFMGFENTGGTYNSRLSTVLPQVAGDEMRIKSFFSQRGMDIPPRFGVFKEDNR